MEEEFNIEAKQSANREDQKPVTPDYGAGPSNVPYYIPTPAYAPHPMYAQPDYRHCGMMYGYQNNYPQTWNNQSFHMQSDNKSAVHQRYMYDLCKRYKYHFIQCEGMDGQMYDGIIDGVSDEDVYLLMPVGDMDRENQGDRPRQFDYGYNYGYGGYGYPRRFRRFRRRRFPFFSLRRLFFPYFY
ncbi:hypothetical protein [Virgibacillus alimentarius]|uniref:Spore coat protein n=1 Tax=Virgibacillus alimentarius TaxID=698769 RepID=A0ABS4S7D8_9BACI|nr:hypothetical protein [Virgibacillus alimentarius]MBP2257415.1 hypothetical protein [Virgibacillus alimentarius]